MISNWILAWAPRDQNIEADARSNETFDGFDPKLRVGVSVGSLALKALPEMMVATEEVYQAIKAEKLEIVSGEHSVPYDSQINGGGEVGCGFV